MFDISILKSKEVENINSASYHNLTDRGKIRSFSCSYRVRDKQPFNPRLHKCECFLTKGKGKLAPHIGVKPIMANLEDSPAHRRMGQNP